MANEIYCISHVGGITHVIKLYTGCSSLTPELQAAAVTIYDLKNVIALLTVIHR